MWARIGGLDAAGPYDLRAVAHFLDHVPDRDRAVKVLDQLAPLITSPGVVTLDPGGARGDPHPAGLRAAARSRWPAGCSSPR